MKTLTRLLCVTAFVLAGCTTTSVVSTWKKPGLQSISFKNVVVIAAAKSPATRRTIEDQVVRRLKVPAVASYTLTPNAPVDQELNALVEEGQYDGAIVMRLVSVDKETDWVPGSWSGPYYGYAGWNTYDPGYYTTSTYVRIETNFYKLQPSEELVWAATSKSVNPDNLNQLIDETVEAVTKELQKQGLLAPRVATRLQ